MRSFLQQMELPVKEQSQLNGLNTNRKDIQDSQYR